MYYFLLTLLQSSPGVRSRKRKQKNLMANSVIRSISILTVSVMAAPVDTLLMMTLQRFTSFAACFRFCHHCVPSIYRESFFVFDRIEIVASNTHEGHPGPHLRPVRSDYVGLCSVACVLPFMFIRSLGSESAYNEMVDFL